MAIGLEIAPPDLAADQAEVDAEFLAIVLAEAPWALGGPELAPPRDGARRPSRVVRPSRSAVHGRPRRRRWRVRVDPRRPVAVARSPPRVRT